MLVLYLAEEKCIDMERKDLKGKGIIKYKSRIHIQLVDPHSCSVPVAALVFPSLHLL